MNIRFYIDMTVEGNEAVDAVKARFRRLEDEKDLYRDPKVRMYGFTFQQNEEGTYVEYDHFLVGVPTALTAETNLTIRRVEMYEDFPLPSRYDSTQGSEPKFRMPRGVYENDGAEAIVDEFQQRGDTGGAYMRLRVVADTLEPAVTLFNLIRKGEAEPTEPWIDAPLVGALNEVLRNGA